MKRFLALALTMLLALTTLFLVACNGGDESAAFEKVANDLNDVSAIIVSKIGEGAASYMEGKGKVVYEAPFEIEPLISNIISNRLFETDNWSAVQ